MDNKRSISEKYSLDYYRHSLPTRAWKSRWNYFALLLALLAFGGMYFFGRNTTFQAAPVASVHLSFGTDCSRCHEQAWGAGQRLVSGSNHSFSVSDTACKQCHPAGPHATILKAEPMCAECHQEHRPGKRLTEVANNACIRCHSDLEGAVEERKKDKNEAIKVSFEPEIGKFEKGEGGHPEFALKRTSDVGARHAAQLVAKFDKKEGKANWVDRGGVIFNHEMHLNSKYVWEPDSPDRKPLTCNNCHVSRADGYMEPIKYDAHCKRCHNLKLGGEFADLGEIPHRQLEEVRGVVRERAAKKFANAVPKKDSDSKTQFLRLPRPARLTEDQEHKLSDLTARAEQALLRPTPKNERFSTCARCHYFGKLDGLDGDSYVEKQNPAFADDVKQLHRPDKTKVEAVPSRWMRHATFNHNSHRAIECAECHHDVCKLKDTTDIMLPSIDDCRRCHGADNQTASPHISADCVLCHIYHKEPADKGFHGKPLEKLFSNGAKPAAGGAAK